MNKLITITTSFYYTLSPTMCTMRGTPSIIISEQTGLESYTHLSDYYGSQW